jgi:hypothetical protein
LKYTCQSQKKKEASNQVDDLGDGNSKAPLEECKYTRLGDAAGRPECCVIEGGKVLFRGPARVLRGSRGARTPFMTALE